MKKRTIVLGALISLTIAGGVFVYQNTYASQAAGKSVNHDSYVTLSPSLDALINDFNDAAGSVRMIFVVGPSCAPCLRGLDDMNRVVGDLTRKNPHLKAFVLYVPTLRANEQHAARAIRLMKGADILHYWDPAGQSGLELQKALGIDAYAWDVWLLFDRDAEWTKGGAPSPEHWEHQLGGLPLEKKLEPNRFAAKVVSLLDRDEIDD